MATVAQARRAVARLDKRLANLARPILHAWTKEIRETNILTGKYVPANVSRSYLQIERARNRLQARIDKTRLGAK